MRGFSNGAGSKAESTVAMQDSSRGSLGIGRTSIQVFIVIVAGAALQFLFHVFLARILGIDQYGIYAFGFSVFTLSLLVTKLSGDTLILRDLSITEDERSVHQLFVFLLVTSVSLFAALIIGYFLLNRAGLISDRYAESLLGFLQILPLGILLRYTMAWARVKGRVVHSQFGDQVVRPLVASIVLLILSRGADVGISGAILAFTAGMAAGLLVTAFPLFSMRGLSGAISGFSISGSGFAARLKSAVTITAVSGQNVAIKQIDVLFLGVLSIPAVVGGYSAATKIAVLAAFILSAVNMVVAPLMARAYAERRFADLQRILTQSSRLIAVFSILFWAVVFFAAEFLLAFFGTGFTDADVALRILVSAQLVNALVGPVGTLLNMTNQERVAVRILAISLVICVVLNVFLVPSYQGIGAAIAYSVAIITWNVSMALYARFRMGLNTTVFQW